MLILNFVKPVSPEILRETVFALQHFHPDKACNAHDAGAIVFAHQYDNDNTTCYLECWDDCGIDIFFYSRADGLPDSLVYKHEKLHPERLTFLARLAAALGGGTILDSNDAAHPITIDAADDPYKNLKTRSLSVGNFSKWHPILKQVMDKCPQLEVPETIELTIPIDVLSCAVTDDNSCYVLPANWLENHAARLIQQKKWNNRLLHLRTDNYISQHYGRTPFLCAAPTMCMLLQEQFRRIGKNTKVLPRRLVIQPAIETNAPVLNGNLPLIPFFRAFYDFTTHDLLYVWNLWDTYSVKPTLQSTSDRILFESQSDALEKAFQNNRYCLSAYLDKALASVNTLSGPWAMDFFYLSDSDKFVLRNAMPAERAAFWNCRPGNQRLVALSLIRDETALRRTDYKTARAAAKLWFEQSANLRHLGF